MKTIKLLALLVVTSIAFTSCSKDDNGPENEEELITNVTYTLTNGNNVVTLAFEDLDGEGGKAGTYSISGPLKANTTYTGVIKLENKTEKPAEDITLEVKKENDEHEFFYTSSISGITIKKTDVDRNNNPLGIKSTLTTAAAGSGSITIILKHKPKKPNSGKASEAGGSTDVEVAFKNVTIK
ncbi:type 1 periplasmic binding fold superfamily protein [Polaribacter cellanae]|uniref:Type 1 periplasmic binding fold superfamily protein n=2 Tax=Polaribacter cellanae TaxID=2818493 RepID=A0A975H8F0_9FLAO|nr:type 1 periplasmic binding fold superfamily protein [Polaribacter cellanae]